MKIVQKCGPCDSEITAEHDDANAVLDVVREWRRDHRCLPADTRTGTGFAATITATDRIPGWRWDATGPRRVEA